MTTVDFGGSENRAAIMITNSLEIAAADWQAVLRRDRGFDGKFVYAALTTGIYCRPSCPGRHPHIRNTLIFPTGADAEREGFIACRRCHPRSDLTSSETSIKAALDYIETHIEQKITLNSLSQIAGLSPNHLQQTFKRIVGLSPKAFCDARRIVHLKRHLKKGESVIKATYAAGYGSSRALYEKAGKGLGMTPASYARGGHGVNILYAIVDSDVRRTLIAASKRGLCAVHSGQNDNALLARLHEEFPDALAARKSAVPSRWIAAVRSCRNSDPLLSKLSRDVQDRVFQARLWKALTQ